VERIRRPQRVQMVGAQPQRSRLNGGSTQYGRMLLQPTFTEYQRYTGKTTDWVELGPTDTGYADTLRGDAGGWYRLEVRIENVQGDSESSWQPPPDTAVPERRPLTNYYQRPALVMHVGIGDVFIIAGQSNSANSGWPPQAPRDERVVTFDGRDWQPAYDPQPLATNHGGSPWPILGDMLVRSLQVPVGFVSLGQGGSTVATWQPQNKQFYPLLRRLVNRLGPHGARGVLWHQGYSDARDRTSKEAYFKVSWP